MKAVTISICWTVAAAAAVYMVCAPNGGIAYSSPMAIAGLGLIGLGLCLRARRHA